MVYISQNKNSTKNKENIQKLEEDITKFEL